MVVRRDISSAVKLRNRVAEFLEDYSWFDTRKKQLACSGLMSDPLER